MNLMLTNICNQRCPYCFAFDELRSKSSILHKDWWISKRNVEFVFNFLAKSGVNILGLIGGEPTLHPNFIEICNNAILKGLHLKIFTNGIFDIEIADYLRTLNDKQINILVNLNEEKEYDPSIYKIICDNLEVLGGKASLSFNIYKLDNSISGHLRLINNTNIKKNIRLGITQPISNNHNTCIKNDELTDVSKLIVEFASVASVSNVRIGFDCGFDRCSFTEEQLKTLHLNGANVQFRCEPALDVDLDLNVMSCFPLGSILRTNLKEHENLHQLQTSMREKLIELRSGLLKDTCSNCKQFTFGMCKGGCASRMLSQI